METEVLIPLVTFIVGVLSYILVIRQYKGKPHSVQTWMHVLFLGFLTWAFFTILVRIAPNEIIALIFLKIATIGIIVNYLAEYLFNVPFVSTSTRRPFHHYLFIALFGFNVYFILFTDFVSVYYDPNTGYWFDSISGTAYIFLLIQSGWGAIWVIRGLIVTKFFESFYRRDSENSMISPQIIIAIVLFVTAYVILNQTLNSSTAVADAKDSTGFILFGSIVAAFYGYVYGIRPVSSVLASQKIWAFIVVDPSGIPVAIKSYEEIFDFFLFSSGIRIFNTIFRDQLRSVSDLSLIKMKDKVVLVNSYHDYIFALISQVENIQSKIILSEVSAGLIQRANFMSPDSMELRGTLPEVLELTMTEVMEVTK